VSIRLSYATVARGGARIDQTATARKSKATGAARGPSTILNDSQILELRALSDFAGWSRQRLMRHYGIDWSTADRYLSGQTRAKLIAKPEHLPPGVIASLGGDK